MRNFLARIAASVLQTQTPARSRLQPMLGSIYAPDATFGPADSSLSTTSVAHDTKSIARTASPAVFAAPQSDPWPHLGDTAHNEPHGTRTDAEQPQDTSDRGIGQRYLHPEAPLLPLEPFASKISSDTKSSTSNETTRQQSVTTVPSLQPSTATQPLMPHAPQAIRVAPLRPAPAAMHTQRTAFNSEPDEIHIHIGRVEVAAVTPPTPRPATAPPRKSINLEEYLRHSNGGHA
jgi:hypothetical protein